MTSETPDHLLCEQCGAQPIDMIMTSLTRDETERLCSPCFVAMCAAIAVGIAENATA